LVSWGLLAPRQLRGQSFAPGRDRRIAAGPAFEQCGGRRTLVGEVEQGFVQHRGFFADTAALAARRDASGEGRIGRGAAGCSSASAGPTEFIAASTRSTRSLFGNGASTSGASGRPI
jgi:hypothetical protein